MTLVNAIRMTMMPFVVIAMSVLLGPNSVTAQCSLLNDSSIQTAVAGWMRVNTREEVESTYGGHIGLWNVSCCTDFRSLFKFSSAFGEDLTRWDTSRAKQMDQLFEVATAFTANLSTWDVSKVTTMNRIFSRSSNFDADRIGVSKWNTKSLTDLRYGFDFSAGFQGDLTGWDTSKLIDCDHMFSDTFAFAGNVSGWDLQKVTSLDSIFRQSDQFTGVVSGWKLSDALQTMRYALSELRDFSPRDREGNATILDWVTDSVRDMSYLAQGSRDLNSDLLATWTTPSLTNLFSAFSKTINFHGTLDSSWTTGKVESLASLFVSSENFTSPLVASFDTSRVTNMREMFKFTNGFAADVSRWKTSNVETMDEFAYESIDFRSDIAAWDLSKVRSMEEAFYGVENFPAHMLATWNTAELKHLVGVFDDAKWADQGDAPFAICWNLNNTDPWDLERTSCKSPGIGFACDCIDIKLVEVINLQCADDLPPCIGVVPALKEMDDAANATATEVQSSASSWQSSIQSWPSILAVVAVCLV